MTRLVNVGARGNCVDWKQALKDLRQDDVLLLQPGYYELPQGLDASNITIKGTGASPEDTVIEGYFEVYESCRFFTMENLCVNNVKGTNTIYVGDKTDTYLTLRNVVLRGTTNDTAAIAVNGRCTVELFSVKIENASLSLFDTADFKLIMTDSIIDYPAEGYAALGIQGKGTAIVSHTRIIGALCTYPGSDAEVDLNNSQVDKALIHGSTWMNMLNSQIVGEDEATFYVSNESWVNIVRSQFKGGVLVDKNTKALIQNSGMDRLMACDNAQLTLNNVAINSHTELQDKTSCEATRTAFSGSPEFEYFLALSKEAKLTGRDILINPNDSTVIVKDDAKLKLNVLTTTSKDLNVSCDNPDNVDIMGMRWSMKKSDK